MNGSAVILALALSVASSADAADRFAIIGVTAGQSIEQAKAHVPALECAASCIAEDQTFYGHSGRFFASLKDDEIASFAFRFKPLLPSEKATPVVSDLTKKYGPPQSDLGGGCMEWALDGGFLAACLTPEMSHIMWSHDSRVDLNLRTPQI